MRWVFVRPRNVSHYYDPEIQEPLGIESLAAVRREAGDQVLLLDGALEGMSDVRLARRAAAFQPDVIGFSLTTARETESVHAIHAECRRALNGRVVRWVAGGNFVSTEPDQAPRRLPAGFQCVRFEGERALESLAATWREGRAPEPVLSGPRVEDLDSLPFAHRDFAGQVMDGGWAFNVQGSRGCQGACYYCASPGMAQGNRWRGRSPAHIVAEVEDLARRYGAYALNFVDEDFLGPEGQAEGRARAIAGLLRGRRMELSFGIQVRPSTLTKGIIDELTSVGLVYVFLGIESDDPADFQRWNRPWVPDPWSLVERLRSRGAEVGAGVLLFHSHSTFAGIRKFAATLRAHRLLEYRSTTNRLDAMPGSFFFRQAREAGRLEADATGPQPLPFVHPEVDRFHRDVIVALEPLGPPSMHAVCSLPPLLSRLRREPRLAPKRTVLMRIIEDLDAEVARTLFALLDAHEGGMADGIDMEGLRRKCLDVGIQGARDLAQQGFAPSIEALREAIRKDSGL